MQMPSIRRRRMTMRRTRLLVPGFLLVWCCGIGPGARADDPNGLAEQLESILKHQTRPSDRPSPAVPELADPQSAGVAWLYLGKVTDWQGAAWTGAPHILAVAPANLAGTRARMIGDSNLRQDAALPPGRDPRGFRATQPAVGVAHDGEFVRILRTEIYPATDSGLAIWALIAR